MALNALLLMGMLSFGEPSEIVIPDVSTTELNEEIAAWLEENVGDVTDSIKRMHILVNLIFSEESLNLVYDNTRTKTAIETFNERNGNCLSFTNLFVGMARHLGMNAYFQEVTNFPTWDRHGEVVVLNRHMNVVVRINNKSYTMDFNPDADRKEQFTRIVSDKRALAQYYNNIGAERFQQRHLEEAVAYFKKSLEIDPKLSFSWSNLGVAYVTMGEMEKAEDAYLKALDNNGREYTAMSNLVRLYQKLDQPEKAEQYEARARRFRNRNPYYHFSLAEQAYEDGDFEQSIKHYRDAIRRKAKVHEFYFGLAKAYSQAGHHGRVAEQLKLAMRYAPNVYDQNRYSQKLDAMAANLTAR